MRSSSIRLFVIAATVGLAATASFAGTVAQDPQDKDMVWQAGVDGVEIEWAPDGGFKRIYSAFHQPVNFPDRRGIAKAQLIAEEKAKAAIVRFMDQQVSSRRVIEQVESDIEKAARTQAQGGGETWTRENQRHMVETLTEITTSSAQGRLRGVIVLEKGYDEKRAEAWVKVGISQKTIGAADHLQSAINPSTPGGSGTGAAGSRAAPVQPGETMRQPGEVRRTNTRDW